jgi:phosphoribosylformimino-5-aminoimidazole carboxamide ribonucleotide (ProFAR) isomerase
VVDLARKFEGYGIEAIIYTDIGRDGMLTGVNIEATVRLAKAVEVPVYASGGVTTSPTSTSCWRWSPKASKASSWALDL